MAETIRLRLLREPEPPSPDGSAVRFGLQDKKGAMHDGVERAGGLIQFDFELSVAGGPEGSPILAGLLSAGRAEKGSFICPGSGSTVRTS